ncbi:helix-turn-helix domain-containing protein [Psychroflexus sediminis]|uniref:Helix-turn-helix domain-containing protein n=1 Tax=Psychroflexus sediminis TaxID=470826 RepID=A0A1G7XET3_9FLAO|nr:helix-turn-helix domain-containing protein [Psychroflexus sediminis]SDG82591.1 Helix-turn-helix domain-containing protein [Psychroflexus sediminis]
MKSKLFVLTKNGELHPVEDLQVKFENETGGLIKSPRSSYSDTTSNEHFDVKGIAEFLGMKPSGIYGLVHKRKIPHIKKGKRLYFFKDKILDWLRNGNVDTDQDIQNQADEYLRNHKV